MGFIIYRTDELNTNERIISLYKKELHASHIINVAKKQKHYGTKWYRKNVSMDFPSSRRYKRMKALVTYAYKKNRKKYDLLTQLGKVI